MRAEVPMGLGTFRQRPRSAGAGEVDRAEPVLATPGPALLMTGPARHGVLCHARLVYETSGPPRGFEAVHHSKQGVRHASSGRIR